MEKMKRNEYLKVRENYEKERNQQSDTLDKYIFTISTGAFGLSFLFIEKIVRGQIQNTELLVLSWVMFALSVISSLLSFICSKIALEKTIEEYDKMYKDLAHEFKMPVQDILTSIFNWYAIGFLFMGFISFIIFGYFNVIGE